MTHLPRELTAEFPGQQDWLAELAAGDTAFARLAQEFRDLCWAVRGVEHAAMPAMARVAEDLSRKRDAVRRRIACALVLAAEGVR